MRRSPRQLFAIALAGALASAPAAAFSWEMTGTKEIAVHTRDGRNIAIGTVTFRPQGERTGR